MRKIMTVLGARPQFIKASVVSNVIAQSDRLSETTIHTGQHFDENMSDVFFSELAMEKPAYHLNIHGGSHGSMTARMLSGIEEVLLADRPDAVLVYGDTNSTLAGALAAVKLHIPVAHVEAGLRSFNMAMPEEINRVLTDRISSWLFTPTDVAAQNLRREGISEDSIIPVGDVMFDVACRFGERVKAEGGLLADMGLAPQEYVLATVHRAENTDEPERLSVVVEAFEMIGRDHPVVWPMHPRTRNVLQDLGRLDNLGAGIRVIEPVGYLDMVQLEKYAAVIATDSGGMQKEAYFHKVPCVTLRDETEWVELVSAGWNRLAPPHCAESLATEIKAAFGRSGQAIDLYGDGNAAGKILKYLENNIHG